MNEITRIHLAKVPYEIEVDAKKDLDNYLSGLKNRIDDEVAADIEIRMTEILEELGVKPSGVITAVDVAAIKSQIGSLEEIADEGITAVEKPARKLYRDIDESIVAGVASGMAKYFQLDVTLIRIIFILIIVLTSGVALIGYALLWLLVPEARTTADKLRLHGQKVTADRIAAWNDEVEPVAARRRGQIVRRGLLYLLGIGAIFGAVASLATVFVVMGPAWNSTELIGEVQNSPAMFAALILAVLSGILLSVLFSLIAVACFLRNFSKRLLIAMAVVIGLGLISFGSAIAGATFNSWNEHQQWRQNIEQRAVTLPADFENITAMRVESDLPVNIEYTVSDQTGATIESISDFKPQVEIDGQVAVVSLNSNDRAGGFMQPVIRISGPALEEIDTKNGYLNYTAETQDNLQITLSGMAGGNLYGSIENLQSNLSDDSDFDATSASIENATLNLSGNSNAELGNIAQLNISHPEACPAHTEQTVEVSHIASGQLKINDRTENLRDYSSPCLELNYDDDN